MLSFNTNYDTNPRSQIGSDHVWALERLTLTERQERMVMKIYFFELVPVDLELGCRGESARYSA